MDTRLNVRDSGWTGGRCWLLPSEVLWPLSLLSAPYCRRESYFFRVHPLDTAWAVFFPLFHFLSLLKLLLLRKA